MYGGDDALSSEWPNLNNNNAETSHTQSKPSSAVDWTFGVKEEDRNDGRKGETRFLPPEPGEKLILDPPEEPIASNVWSIGGSLGGKGGGGGAASKVKVKSFGYQRTESSIHGSMAHGNVKKVNGQLVNDFTPTLEQAMAEKPGQTNNPLLVKQFQNGVKLPVSALCEWGSQSRNKVDFKEVAVAKENLRKGSFACVAITNGYRHDQGVGRTKKEAKHRAASIAFCNLYKLDNPPDDDPANYKLGASKANTAGSQVFPKVNHIDAFPSWNSGPGANAFDQQQGYVDMEQRKWFQAELQSETTYDNRSTGNPSGYVPPHLQNLACSGGPPPGFESDGFLTDADVVYKKFEAKIATLKGTLDRQVANRVSTNWAAFLVQRENTDAADSEVVAVGAGCGHIRNEPDSDSHGSLLHDSHALVLARRSFLRYLYKSYDDAVSNNETQKQQSILVLGRSCATSQSTSYIARLKEGVQIHVCMVASPCGEALQKGAKEDKDHRLTQKDIDVILAGDHFSATDDRNSGKVHVKQRGWETVCGTDNVTRQAFESVSCSDKMFKWNVLGVQGTLLSYFMEPIYVTSVNIGSKFSHTPFVSSTCCRGVSSSALSLLKEPYCLNHPFVGRTTLSRAKDMDFTEGHNNNFKLALNWYCSDDKIELTDPLTGIVAEESPVKPLSTKRGSKSRICKNAFWFRFVTVLKRLRWVKGESDANSKFTSYQGSKAQAAGMAAAKRVFETAINAAGKGRWSEVEIKRGVLYFK